MTNEQIAGAKIFLEAMEDDFVKSAKLEAKKAALIIRMKQAIFDKRESKIKEVIEKYNAILHS